MKLSDVVQKGLNGIISEHGDCYGNPVVFIGVATAKGYISTYTLNNSDYSFSEVRLAQQEILNAFQRSQQNGPTKCPFRKKKSTVGLTEQAFDNFWGS